MRDTLKLAYRVLLDDAAYGFLPWRFRPPLRIRGPYGLWEERVAILLEEALERYWGVLRPDATLMLAINLRDLVIRPLLIESEAPDEMFSELARVIKHDVDMIVATAQEGAIDPRSEEGLSSGAMFRAVGQLWGRLALNQTRWWGVEDE